MGQGALGSELDGNPAERRAIWNQEDSRFWTSSWPAHSFSNYKHCDMLNLLYSPCTAAMKKINTSYSSVFLSWPVLSCMRIPARSLPCSRSGFCSFREGDLCELVQLRQVFVRGG